MNPRDRKLAVLRQLSQESEPITLSLLVSKLELKFTDRTVRRWLMVLIEEGLVVKSGHTKNTKYVAVKGGGVISDQISSCFGSDSLKAIEQVKRPPFERKPVAYNDTWFDSYHPNFSFYLSDSIRMQLHKFGQRANNQDPAGTYAHQIFNRLLIDLSFNSSRLEGNTYSLLDTERLLLHGNSAEGKLDEEKIMILNHKEAIRYLVENATRISITRNVICTIHYLLAEGLLEPKYAGKLRDHSVRIGGSTYMPFEDYGRLDSQLQKIVDKAEKIKDPFEQSLFLLIHISYLQAFADVNKRTARLCANIPLITKNLVPLSFNDVERDDYISAMIAIYELQDVHPITDLYVYSYLRTCAAYDSTVKVIGYDEVRVRYRQQRRAIIREIIVQCLLGNQIKEYAQQKMMNVIPESVQNKFIEDLMEDLEQMDESRIAGLGITQEELNKWLRSFNEQNKG